MKTADLLIAVNTVWVVVAAVLVMFMQAGFAFLEAGLTRMKERIGIDDPIGAVAVHGCAGVWGTLATGIFAVPALAEKLATGTGGLLYTSSFHRLGVQALGLLAVGTFTFSASFAALWAMKAAIGIRAEPEVETAGLDVSEHGMWGYPEFYIPVPGGYSTQAHGHLGVVHSSQRDAPIQVVPAPIRTYGAEGRDGPT